MTQKEMEKWFIEHEGFYLDCRYSVGAFSMSMEEMYQAFKARLMQECSVIERMTTEEYDEWSKNMVVQK